VRDPAKALAHESATAPALENPFLHMGLHMAVREQISIDRPPGIRALHAHLASRHGDVHDAEHILTECLGQTLWQAQRDGKMPDESHYLDLVRQRLAKG